MATVERLDGQLETIVQSGGIGYLGDGPVLQFQPDVNGAITTQSVVGGGSSLSDPESAYRSESALRTVTDYIVGRGAIVPIDAYVKVSNAERQPIETGVVPEMLEHPFPGDGIMAWLAEILYDVLLWDRFACLICYAPDIDTGQPRLSLARLAPWLWRYGNANSTDRTPNHSITVAGRIEIPRSVLVTAHGRGTGTAATSSLQQLLLDLREGSAYRAQTWQRGARISGVIERPLDAPKWSTDSADRLRGQWRELWANRGPEAGGTPTLEDGMTFKSLNAFSARDTQYQEGRLLSLIEACMFFHLAPEAIGARPGTYANQKEHRKDIYEGTLAALLKPIAEALTFQFVRRFHPDPRAYSAFDIDLMIQGTMDEVIAMMTTAVGGPWILRDEVRAMFNRPPLPDGKGSELIVPMNVTSGGLPSPHSTAPGVIPAAGVAKELEVLSAQLHQAIDSTGTMTTSSVHAGVKAARKPRRPAGVAKMTEHLAEGIGSVYRAMRRDVMRQHANAQKAATELTWQDERWLKDFEAAILKSTPTIASLGAHHVLSQHAPDYDWSDDPMTAWLEAQARSKSAELNESAKRNVIAAIGLGDQAKDALSAIFDRGEQATAQSVADSLSLDAVGLGYHDAAKASGLRTKTWRVTSVHPRDSHAAIDGETVPLESVFSLGGRWPGDRNMSVDETAGCTCQMEVSP